MCQALPLRRSSAPMPPQGASSAASASPSRSQASHASHSTTTSLDLSYLTHDTTLPDNDLDFAAPSAAAAAAAAATITTRVPPVPLPDLLHDLHTSSATLLEASQRAVDVFAACASTSPSGTPDGAPASAISRAHLSAMLRLRSAVDTIREHSDAFLACSTSSADAHEPKHSSPGQSRQPAAVASWNACAFDLCGGASYTTPQGLGQEKLVPDSGGPCHLSSAPPTGRTSIWPVCFSAPQEPDGAEETYDDEYICDPTPWSRSSGNNKKRKSIRAKSSEGPAEPASDNALHPTSPSLPINSIGTTQQCQGGPKDHALPAMTNRARVSLFSERQVSRRQGTTRQKSCSDNGPPILDVCLPSISVSSAHPLQVRLDPPTRPDGTSWPDPRAIQLPGLTTRVPIALPAKKKKLSKAEKKAKVHTKSRARRPTLAELRARVQEAKAEERSHGCSSSGLLTDARFTWTPPTVTWPVVKASPPPSSPPLNLLSCQLPQATTREPFTFIVTNRLPFPTQVPQLACFAPALARPQPVGEHEYLMLFQRQLAAALTPVTEAERHLVEARNAPGAAACGPAGHDSEPTRLVQAALDAIATARLAIPSALLTGLGALEKARSRVVTRLVKPSDSPLFVAPRPAETGQSPTLDHQTEPKDKALAPTQRSGEPKTYHSSTQPPSKVPDMALKSAASTTPACAELGAPIDATSERRGRKAKPKKLSRRKKAAMNNVHHRCNWSLREVVGNIDNKQTPSGSPQRVGNDIPTGCLDHPTTSNVLFPEEYVCLLCDYELLYGEEPRMLASIRRRVRVEESRSWAQARAHRLAKGQCPHDTGCGCADWPYPD